MGQALGTWYSRKEFAMPLPTSAMNSTCVMVSHAGELACAVSDLFF